MLFQKLSNSKKLNFFLIHFKGVSESIFKTWIAQCFLHHMWPKVLVTQDKNYYQFLPYRAHFGLVKESDRQGMD